MNPIFYIRDQYTMANEAAACFIIKFYWNIAMTIHIVCGCLCTSVAELSLLQNLKMFTPGPLQKKFPASDLCYKMYSDFGVHFTNAIFIGKLKLFMGGAIK